MNPEAQAERTIGGLDASTVVEMYRHIYASRRLDDKEIQLKRQNRIFFQISGAGHEGVLAAAGPLLKPGEDWFYLYYRDRALCLALGMSYDAMLLQAVGAASDPQSGGRQMPSHWGSTELNIVSTSSPTGTQFLNAVGCAEAGWRMARIDGLEERGERDEIVLVSSGDGTTSEGEFWESLNTACNLRLPVLYLIEDNGYAISVPVEVQTAGGSISKLVRDFPDLHLEEVDGCDPMASHGALERAISWCRERKGPALVHAHVIRPYSHSLSDDERMYRPDPEREEEAGRDPFTTFPRRLVEEGIVTEDELEAVRAEVDREIEAATERALAAPQPAPETALDFVYSPDVDPTSDAFATDPRFEGEPTTMVDLLNAAMRDEMERDPRIVLFGEDVADASRENVLDAVKGKGGVFKVTANLQRRFGGVRVFNSPLAEANIVGRAVGMATRGLKPVVEIQFFDYIWPAYHQIRNELALLRWRSNDDFSAPVVLRVPCGGYLKGGAIYHSQSGTTLFTANPGLRVVMPANAEDANGLLRTAIRCEDPVLFLEHKHLYRQAYNKGRYPGPDYMIPFGRAARVREGDDLTIVTYGGTVQRSLVAAKEMSEKEGIEAEILDLRTLSPYDWDAVATSVRRTSRALLVYEDPISWGFGAEIAARIADELFEWLDGPVRRVAALDSQVGYAPALEDAILPQVEDIRDGIRELARY
ncbi:MAG TPA: dehydrogenase E1 component subunit alpha/beta [Gemmatimonadota bacterium]|nr:dehydrogenase E1 component subunit alpha/beta [Gemmatimonadota bacterium]